MNKAYRAEVPGFSREKLFTNPVIIKRGLKMVVEGIGFKLHVHGIPGNQSYMTGIKILLFQDLLKVFQVKRRIQRITHLHDSWKLARSVFFPHFVKDAVLDVVKLYDGRDQFNPFSTDVHNLKPKRPGGLFRSIRIACSNLQFFSWFIKNSNQDGHDNNDSNNKKDDDKT